MGRPRVSRRSGCWFLRRDAAGTGGREGESSQMETPAWGRARTRRKLTALALLFLSGRRPGHTSSFCLAVEKSSKERGVAEGEYNGRDKMKETGEKTGRKEDHVTHLLRRQIKGVRVHFLVMVAWIRPLGLETGSKTSTPPSRPLPFSRPKADRLMGL